MGIPIHAGADVCVDKKRKPEGDLNNAEIPLPVNRADGFRVMSFLLQDRFDLNFYYDFQLQPALILSLV